MAGERAILIVDDEAIILMAMRQELRLALGPGFRFELALSADEALKALDALTEEGVSVALVITDWLMPGIRGDELIVRIRSDHPGVNTIIVSGQTDGDALQALEKAGALDAFLVKPWDGRTLASECRRLLGLAETPPTP